MEEKHMKKDLTELVFILDRSGSMAGLESDTIGGYNAMLAKQKETAGEAVITTVLFDDNYELLHDRIALEGVQPITSKEYFVRGSTALLDAVGKTILKIENVQKNTAEAARAEKVVFVITTDGYENASREFSYAKIKSMISKLKEKYAWEFIFLGANIDAAAEAEKFGIDKNRAAQYHNDEQGVKLNYAVVSDAISELRASKSLSDDWKAEIESDYISRK
jgi:uncharacterized protein YegL